MIEFRLSFYSPYWTVLVQNQSSNLKQRAKLIRAKYTLSQFGHFSHFSSFNFCFFSRKWDIIVWYTKSSFPSMTTSYQHHSHPEEWALSRDSTCQGGLETLELESWEEGPRAQHWCCWFWRVCRARPRLRVSANANEELLVVAYYDVIMITNYTG